MNAKAALALALALNGPADPMAGPPQQSYADARAQAAAEGRPLLIFVGQTARQVRGCVCVRWDDCPRSPAAGVVVGVPDGRGDLTRLVTLIGTPGDAAILSHLTPAVPAAFYAPAFSGADCGPGG